MPKNKPDLNYKKEIMKRRTFLYKLAAVSGITAVSGYLSLAPENWPLSLKDFTGHRSHPKPKPFQINSFAVPRPVSKADIGIGRQGDIMTKLRKAIDGIGGIEHYIKKGDVVLIKPNVAFDRIPELGATTNPDILAELIKLLLVDCKASEVRVADNPIESPHDCFEKSKIGPTALSNGARIYLPDSNAFKILNSPGTVLIEYWPFFARPFNGVDKVIGLTPVKDHNLCSASLGMKNWYGLLGGVRNQFHQDIHEIVSDLAVMIKPTFTILDGTNILMENGPNGGDPSNVKKGDVVMASVDPVAQDAYAFRHLLERSELPAYIMKAQEKGVGNMNYQGRVKEII